MFVRLWSLASVGEKPAKTDEPIGAGPILSWSRWPPLIHEARSPSVILKLSRRNCAPRATLTGDARPRLTDFARLTPAMISRRCNRPAKNDSWFAIPGSSAAPAPPRIPSGPGAHATTRQGPSDALLVW